ncbi:MAG: hypothetical protein ACRD0O_10995 [Acidimicrobiia bacterium]
MESRGRHRPLVAVLAGLIVMAVTLAGHDVASSSHAGGDTVWTTYESLSLVKEHNLTLNEWQGVLDEHPIHWGPNGHGDPAYVFPWGTAVVVAPIIGFLAAWDALAGHSLEDTLRDGFPPHEVENTVASALVALAAGLIYLIALWELRSWAAAAAVALAFAFATSAFSTASRALWSHGPAVLLIAAELAILVRARHGTPRRDRLVPLLGPLFVLAYAVRPPTAVIAVALTGVVAVAHRRRLLPAVAATAVAGGAYVAVNMAAYQKLQLDYYDANRLTGSGTFFEALAGNLVSPQRGLLIWCPIVLLAVAGVVVARRQGTFDALTGGLVVALVLYWLVISTLGPWWAGYSTGPRLFTDALPLLVVLALPAVARLRQGGWRGWLSRIVVAALLGFSLFTNHRGATRFETQLWNDRPASVDLNAGRVWDWDDLQFLR